MTTDHIDRRGFFRIGGITVATAAIFAACGNDDERTAAGEEEEKGAETASPADITTLRAASSIETYVIDAYQRVIDTGLVTGAALKDAVTAFQEHHRAHLDLFVGATKERGGEVMDKPNAALQQRLQPAFAALRDEASAARVLFDLENAVAATYVAATGRFEDATLNQPFMSVGGTDARHAAVLAAASGQPAVAAAFFATSGAIA